MTEKLRLEAEMRDNASPVVRKLKKEIEAIRATPGMAAVTGWLGEFKKTSDEFIKGGGGASSVMNSMGLGGLSAAASMAALVMQMKALGERAIEMKELGREVGLTTDQINAFSHAGMHFGVSADVMKGALNHLAGQMPEFRRNLGPLMQELGRWPTLIKKLQSEGTSDQLKDIFSFLGKADIQREPQLQKKLLEVFFGNGDEMEKLMAQGAKGILGEIDKQQRSLGPISPEMLKQAQDFRDAQIAFGDEIEKFETKIGPAFLSGMTAIVKEGEKLVALFDSPVLKWLYEAEQRGEKGVAGVLGKMFGDQPAEPAQPRKPGIVGMRKDRGLFHHTAFGDNSPTAAFGLEETIAAGTKTGVLDAFREWLAMKDAEKGGIHFASYEPGGNGRGEGGSGTRGFGDGWNRSHPASGGGQGGGWHGNGVPAGSNAHHLTDLITSEANKAGIDPRILEGIRAGESGHSGTYDHNGKGEDSWGPMQLNRQGGLGNDFERDTGLDLSDPRTIPDQVRWVAQYIKKHGRGALGNWHGYHGDRDADPRWGDAGYVADAHAGRRALAARLAATRGRTASAAGAMPDWMGDRSKRELAGVNRELAENLLSASRLSGIHFDVTQGLRTQAEADRNAVSGRGVRDSQHLYGAAADIAMIDPRTGQRTYDRGVYESFAKAFRQVNEQRGTHQRWLGDSAGRWGSDIVHFDQGLGYGQSHKRDPYGVGGPTAADIAAGNSDAYRSPSNPFTRRSATGLLPSSVGGSASTPPQEPTHVKVEIHDHGTGNKVRVKTSGLASHTLKRWPTNTEASDVG